MSYQTADANLIAVQGDRVELRHAGNVDQDIEAGAQTALQFD